MSYSDRDSPSFCELCTAVHEQNKWKIWFPKQMLLDPNSTRSDSMLLLFIGPPGLCWLFRATLGHYTSFCACQCVRIRTHLYFSWHTPENYHRSHESELLKTGRSWPLAVFSISFDSTVIGPWLHQRTAAHLKNGKCVKNGESAPLFMNSRNSC